MAENAGTLLTMCGMGDSMLSLGDRNAYHSDVLRLYEQYRKGATPKARPLQLKIKDKLTYEDPHRGVTSYLFNASLSDIRQYLDDNDVGRLVARNIRYNLGGRVG